MREKKPKSTVLVLTVIMFLSLFIILPPLFRAVSPRQAPIETRNIVILSCVKISANENYKITSKVIYENGVATRNNINYITYVAGPGEGNFVDSGEESVKTAAEEIALFRSIPDLKITDGESSIFVSLNASDIEANSGNLELVNYLLPAIDQQEAFYISQGYECETINS